MAFLGKLFMSLFYRQLQDDKGVDFMNQNVVKPVSISTNEFKEEGC